MTRRQKERKNPPPQDLGGSGVWRNLVQRYAKPTSKAANRARGKKGKGIKGKAPATSPPLVDPRFLKIYLLLGLSLLMAVLSLPALLPQRVDFNLGDIADKDIKAPRDLIILDRLATASKREAAGERTPLVFDLDDQAAGRAVQVIMDIFNEGRRLHRLAPEGAAEPIDAAQEQAIQEYKEKFNATFGFGKRYAAYKTLVHDNFSVEAEEFIARLVTEYLNRGIISDLEYREARGEELMVRHIFSKEVESDRQATAYLQHSVAQQAVMERALLYRGDYKTWQVNSMVAIAQALLAPNLSLNRAETQRLRREAVRQVAPVFFQVKQGEMIVREGQRVDTKVRQKLEALSGGASEVHVIFRLGGVFLLTGIFLTVLYITGLKSDSRIRLSDKDLALAVTLTALGLLMAALGQGVGQTLAKAGLSVELSTVLYFAPLSLTGMMSAIFLGVYPAIIISMLTAILAGLLLGSFPMALYFFIGMCAGIAAIERMGERGVAIKSGLVVAGVNMALVLALGLYLETFWSLKTLVDLAAGFTNGLLAGIIVTGLIPLFEMVFGYTTSVKLLELANLDRPLLRELMVQAPGTYHHCVIVGNLVEAAAGSIGANPLLAKVAAYYHDLGKLKKPLYFVENQGRGHNKHEKLAPSMSALILISHVKDGAELARASRLGQDILDIIRQHHGTSIISYFYQKAVEAREEGQPCINEADFRYPGPRPQTKEAGLVMLADAAEAASRTLQDPTPARIQGLVQKIINNFFSDGQLDECELTLKDLHLIAASFNKILTGIFHRRIEYPESAAKDGERRKNNANGNKNKQSANGPADRDRPPGQPGKEDLKRLGM